jgi:hypothetical protein
MHERGIFVAPIEKLKAERQEKKTAKAVLPERAKTSEGRPPVIVKNAICSRHPPNDEERQRRINFVQPFAVEAQAEASAPRQTELRSC